MRTLLALLFATLTAATPLLLGALGGIFSERSGVINIALEGIMLSGAWAAAYFALLTGSPWAGLLGAVVVGTLMAGLHAIATIPLKANQVVVGVAINLLAAGFTEFMAIRLWGSGQSPAVLRGVPGIAFICLAFVLAAVTYFMLYRTPWGLRLRAVGEHPEAAATVGINVRQMRYWGVLLSGVLAGLAGASLSIGFLSRYTVGMTAGRGFIALAAMIFGGWNPVRTIWACLLFGFAQGLATLFQIWRVALPAEFLLMAPYVLTILALAGFVGRVRPPAAEGLPYDPGQ